MKWKNIHIWKKFQLSSINSKQNNMPVTNTSSQSNEELVGAAKLDIILMAQCKTGVTPLLMQWSYRSLARSQWFTTQLTSGIGFPWPTGYHNKA